MEMKLLDFHINNLEYACGSTLSNVSALNWDQNERYPQFQGDHTIVTYGFSDILERLAKPLDIRRNTPVQTITDTGDEIIVTDRSGNEHTADRCIVTVPLSLMKKKTIKFQPELSARKQLAIDRLGAGLIEKILLKYDTKWWGYKIGGADFFGRININGSDSGVDAEDDHEHSGIFNVFYDVPSPDNNQHTLLSIVSGAALPAYNALSDEELVKAAHQSLQEIFKEIDIPQPDDHFITRWGKEEYSQMSYSYVHIGADGSDYDEMAKPESLRLMFAGEATNRHFPQTVTGAYLTGVREAARVYHLDNQNRHHPSMDDDDIKTEPVNGTSDPVGHTTPVKKRKSDGQMNGSREQRDSDKKLRRRSDRSKHATSYVELDEEFF